MNPIHGAPNTDGFDPDSSEYVQLLDSTISAGDDAVAIKSGWDCKGYENPQSTRNVLIRNLTVLGTSCAGLAVGSEMSGGVENVTIENSVFVNVDTGIRIKYGR